MYSLTQRNLPIELKIGKSMLSGSMPKPIGFTFSEVYLASKTMLNTDFESNIIIFHTFMDLERNPILTFLEAPFEWLWVPNYRPFNIFTFLDT